MRASRPRADLVSFSDKDALPGAELLTTDAAREIAGRPQFRGGISHHVYVNGYDLGRVEVEAATKALVLHESEANDAVQRHVARVHPTEQAETSEP